MEQHIAPLLIGQDPDRIEDAFQYLSRGSYWRGGPIQMTAIAGVDLALWDIKGKRAGLPVYSLLGGKCRHGALAYAHASGSDPEAVLDGVRQLMDRGFKVTSIRGEESPLWQPKSRRAPEFRLPHAVVNLGESIHWRKKEA